VWTTVPTGVTKIFEELSVLIRLRKSNARDSWRSLFWNTNIASADVVTLGSMNGARSYGVQHSELWPLVVNP